VVTAACDGAVRVWDARSGDKLADTVDLITDLEIGPADTADGGFVIATASRPLVNRDLFGINF
jgi:WD40 repeat protein